MEEMFLHLLTYFILDLQSVHHSTYVGCGCDDHASYYDFCCRGIPRSPRYFFDFIAMVLFIPYFLIYPVIISVVILLILVLYLFLTLLTACLVYWKCKRRDHENGTVQAIEAQYVGEVSVVNVDAEANYVGGVAVVNVDAEANYVGEVSVVNVDAEAHYVGDVVEVIADVDHSLQSSYICQAVVAA